MINKKTLKILLETHQVILYDKDNNAVFSMLNPSEVDKCKNFERDIKKVDSLYIGFEYKAGCPEINKNYGDSSFYVGKSMKLPKKEVTIEWIMNKINFQSEYKNLCETFNKLIKDENINAYPTSYGIGVFRLFGFEKYTVDKIEKILTEMSVNFKQEYSDAGWVLRFKISKSKDNIKKII